MIGSGELIVILCVLLLLFGGKKLPEFARNLGKGIREFKKACNGAEDEPDNANLIEHEKSESLNPTKKIKTDGHE